jgi:two-component system sensor histidine kinase DesK
MVTVLLDLRRIRQRRWPLAALTLLGLAVPLLALRFPAWEPWLVRPSVFSILLAGLALACAAAASVWSGRSARWLRADDAMWSAALAALACLGALGRAPVTAGLALHGVALLLLALRMPTPVMMIVACLSVMLGTLVRAASGYGAAPVLAYALVSTLLLLAHTLLARATHSLNWALAEREALINDRRERPARHRERPSSPGASAAAVTLRALRAAEAKEPEATDDAGWEALVDRLRTSITTLCDDAGVSSSVKAELRGLAPPSSKMRQGVMKVTQEAANHALRETEARRIVVTLRRADGGLVLEVEDDGTGNEGGRSRKALASIRGKVASLGGSAEVKRADLGWVMRVRLPCEQLN